MKHSIHIDAAPLRDRCNHSPIVTLVGHAAPEVGDRNATTSDSFGAERVQVSTRLAPPPPHAGHAPVRDEEPDRSDPLLADRTRTPGRASSTDRRELLPLARRLRARLERIDRMDHFGTAARAEALNAIEELERMLQEGPDPAPWADRPPTGRRWVTRQDVHVDRIASAWLIRRFIDPEAELRFVTPRGYPATPGELRFDMFEGRYTHEGERCTFETLLARFGLADPALALLGEIVHDIDLRDSRFGHPETAGIEAMIDGLVLAHPSDEARVEQGARLLDGLYTYFQGAGRTPTAPDRSPADASGSSR